MKVRVNMEIAGKRINEDVVGNDADDILAQAKSRVAKELGWKGMFLHVMTTQAFAQEAVRRYNGAFNTEYDLPHSADDFFVWGQDLGYLTILPE